MSSGKLVAHANLTLLGHIHLGHLQYARGKLVANGYGKLLALHLGVKQLVLLHEVDDELRYQLVGVVVVGPLAYLHVAILQVLQVGHGELAAVGYHLCASIVLHSLRDLAVGKHEQLLNEDVLQVVNLCLILLVNLGQEHLVLLLRLARLNGTREYLLVNNHTCQRRVGLQRRVLHVASLVAEDCAQELLLRRRVALALGRNLADKDVARLHTRSNAYHAIVVEILGGLLADVGNVACELLHATLGLAHIERILVNVY